MAYNILENGSGMAMPYNDKTITLKDGDILKLEATSAAQLAAGGSANPGAVYNVRLYRRNEDNQLRDNGLLTETIERQVGDKTEKKEVAMTVDGNTRLVFEGNAKATLAIPEAAGRDPQDSAPRLMVKKNPGEITNVMLLTGSAIIDKESERGIYVAAPPQSQPRLSYNGKEFKFSADAGDGRRQIRIERGSAGIHVDGREGLTPGDEKFHVSYNISGKSTPRANRNAGSEYGLTEDKGDSQTPAKKKEAHPAVHDAKEMRDLNAFTKTPEFLHFQRFPQRENSPHSQNVAEVIKLVQEGMGSKSIEKARAAITKAAEKFEEIGKDGGTGSLFKKKFLKMQEAFEEKFPPHEAEKKTSMIPPHILKQAEESILPSALGLKGAESDLAFNKARERLSTTGQPLMPHGPVRT